MLMAQQLMHQQRIIFGKYITKWTRIASGDLVLNVNVSIDAAVTHAKVITKSSNLNIRKGPGTDQPIVGKAAHDEIITLVNRSNDLWWLVRTKDG